MKGNKIIPYGNVGDETKIARVEQLGHIKERLEKVKPSVDTERFEQLKQALANKNKDGYSKQVKFVKEIDFMTLVEGITDQYSKTSPQDTDADLEAIQETTTFKREIIAPDNDKNNFLDIYNWYKNPDGKPPPGGLEEWQALFLGSKLDELCAGDEKKTQEKIDEKKIKEKIKEKIKQLHIPAMFRYFGATNLRADVTTLSYNTSGSESGYDIKVVSAPHGSHVPLKSDLSNDEKIKIAKESIKSLSKSAISEYLTDEKNEYLDGVDLKQDIYLTTFVSDINIQDRDTKVIDMTRKAAEQADIGENKVFYNNIAIQSGFAMFEDYNLQENKDITESINGKTKDVIEKLKAAKESAYEEKKEKIGKIDKRIELLDNINAEYNKAIDARLSQHQYSNIIFNSLAA
ncbi:MAG: hypothetical protein HON55_01385, partial [Legionellales bacterium]|nr:hypothetical protein [Legionellales bacterium]